MTQEQIDNIKAQTDLPDIVAENTTLHRSGTGFVCTCPFHNEKTPSFHLYAPDTDTPYWRYKCFGCGKAGDAIQFLMERDHLDFVETCKNLAERLGMTLDGQPYQGRKKTPSEQRQPPKKPFYLALARPDKDGNIVNAVEERKSDDSDFCIWLKFLFPKEIRRAVDDYFIGATHDKDGQHVIFWRIDVNGVVRSGKVMRYNPLDGHRLRNGDKDTPDWIHARLRNALVRTGNTNENIKDIFRRIGKATPVPAIKFDQSQHKWVNAQWQLNQTLFGLHLLNHVAYPDNVHKKIVIVESEKTAVVMSLFRPDFIWLSCGGASMLDVCLTNSRDVLKGRQVLAIPDKSKGDQNFYHDWVDVCQRFPDLNIGVTDILEHDTTLGEGEDIADLYLRTLQPRPQPQPTQHVQVKFDPMEGTTDPFTDMDLLSAEFDRIMSEPQPQEPPF